jgi:hypothetical protein
MLTATGSVVTRLFYWQTTRASDHGELDEHRVRAGGADRGADRGDSSTNRLRCWGDSAVVVPARDATAALDRCSRPRATGDRAALLGGGRSARYLAGLMDPFVSLLEIHKLMYFMQEAGEPLRLRYTKALYGPYAENLRQVLAHVEGHFLTGYADGGDAPGKQLELVPGASKDALAFLEAHPDTKARFDRVAELVQGFETPFGMELLATVHWVAVHDGARTVAEAIDAVYLWNDRKRAFEPRQIHVAWVVLDAGGWLRVEPAAARMPC